MVNCYRKANSTDISDTSAVDAACSVITTAELYSPCCPIKSDDALGNGNLCLSEYLCWESSPPSGGSGFLAASCTDQSYESDQCTSHCTDNPVPDVIYNPDTGLWACCGWSYSDGVDCAHPTNETWSGLAPSILLAAASSSSTIAGTATLISSSSILTSVATTSSTTSSSSSSSTSTSTAADTTASSPTSTASSSASSPIASKSSGASGGAKAGIAVGVIAAVVLVALGVFFLWTRNRKQQRGYGDGPGLQRPSVDKPGPRDGEYKYRDYRPPAIEMHSDPPRSELPTDAPMHPADGRTGLAEMS
ncbi:hypothetical protein EDD37DRAFT_224964 [Exophiala viscosa]|uniref:uncharacterized protein n=1 Tax=Exophiala viscosa TaxID=2486360 RepID=UPI0021A033AE|nr:hypothetical protein EDD37DRAFT_224964 [Exophiala viscosa]